jgi:hypothetical protein
MENNYLEIANTFPFWIIALIMLSVVVFQSIIFMKKAFKTGKKIGITDEQFKTTIRASTITSIGPSFAVLIGLVALISLIGSPMAFMRLGVIGAVMFETLCVDAGAEAVGVAANTLGFDLYAFSNVMWVMCVGSIGWLLIAGLFTPKLETFRVKLVRGRDYLLPVLSTAAVLGAFGYQVSRFVVELGPGTVAVLVSALTIVLVNLLSEKTNAKFLKEWALGIAMVTGMFGAVLFS